LILNSTRVKFAAKVIVQWQIGQLLMTEHWNAFATFSKRREKERELKKKKEWRIGKDEKR